MANAYNEEQKALTMNSILEALLNIMVTKAFKNITVSEVCKKAGVSRMGFYRHYGDLDEVLALHLEERFERFLVQANHMELSNTYNTSILLFRYIKQEQDFYGLMIKSGHLETLHLYMENYMIYLFKTLPFGYELDENEMRYYASYRAGGITRLIVAWYNHDFSDSEESMAEMATKFDL